MAEERIEGGGGGVAVAGAADRSVPISLGVGVWWAVVKHSGTLLCLQKNWKCPITSAARLCPHERYPEATHIV